MQTFRQDFCRCLTVRWCYNVITFVVLLVAVVTYLPPPSVSISTVQLLRTYLNFSLLRIAMWHLQCQNEPFDAFLLYLLFTNRHVNTLLPLSDYIYVGFHTLCQSLCPSGLLAPPM